MPRKREFCPKKALQRVLSLFWQKGYFGTSMDELVKETGVSRYGLYSEWGNKHRLYLATLDDYEQHAVADLLALIEHPDASLENIQQFFAMLVKGAQQSEIRVGCIMCNTASEFSRRDPEAAAKVKGYFTRLTHAFQKALMHAKAQQKVRKELDVVAYAQYLTGIVMGLSLYSKTTIDASALEAFVEIGLSHLT